MEKIFLRVRRQSPQEALRKHNEFINNLNGLPIGQAEQQIAEKRFREPIIVFDLFVIRPFWRDGRKAPQLFKSQKMTEGERLRGHF